MSIGYIEWETLYNMPEEEQLRLENFQDGIRQCIDNFLKEGASEGDITWLIRILVDEADEEVILARKEELENADS